MSDAISPIETISTAKAYARNEQDIYGRTSKNLDAICELIIQGKSLKQALESDTGFPSHFVFMQWVKNDEAAQNQYARARIDQADAYADRVVELAEANPEYVTSEGGSSHVDGGEVAHRRLAIDSLKWLAAKRAPKKYGDREANAGPVNVNVGVQILTESDRAKIMEERRLALRASAARAQIGDSRSHEPAKAVTTSNGQTENGASESGSNRPDASDT